MQKESDMGKYELNVTTGVMMWMMFMVRCTSSKAILLLPTFMRILFRRMLITSRLNFIVHTLTITSRILAAHRSIMKLVTRFGVCPCCA